MLLRRYDLRGRDPQTLLAALEENMHREPSAAKLYAYAELAHRAGAQLERRDEKRAFDLYASSVAHAYLYLFDPRYVQGRNEYDPQFRGACDLYNKSLDRALRIVNRHGGFRPGVQHQCQSGKQSLDFAIVSHCGDLCEHEFEKFEFVSDYKTNGLPNHYQRFGLGVPLIAIRKPRPGQPELEKHYPPRMAVPMTAFLRILPTGDSDGLQARTQHGVLELQDPLTTSSVQVANRRVPLECDTTTPLAYFLDKLEYTEYSAATSGFLFPGQTSYRSGLYMLEPYQRGKIPVLMVHGLWSTPIKWMDMINDLRSIPEISQNYQFWYFFYPTGQPFVYSAATLRSELEELRQLLDPRHQEPALDQMVLVGHSMGGLVAKMQTVDSGDLFWNQVAEKPFQKVKGDKEALYELHKTFFFKPNPSIRRVITIATPFGGSDLSNSTTQWLGRRLITPPPVFVKLAEQLHLQNPNLFGKDARRLTRNSIEMLAPNSPALQALAEARRAPWVSYHNIIGTEMEASDSGPVPTGDDSVVSVVSARAPEAVSELIVPADHAVIHRHPRTVLEVRRILLEHLLSLHRPMMPIGYGEP